MITAQNGKGSRARKVNGDKYRASKLWDKKVEHKGEHKGEGELPKQLEEAISKLGSRPGLAVVPVILELCRWKPLTSQQLATYLGRKNAIAFQQDYLKPLISEGKLSYLHPESLKHPKQAYLTTDS